MYCIPLGGTQFQSHLSQCRNMKKESSDSGLVTFLIKYRFVWLNFNSNLHWKATKLYIMKITSLHIWVFPLH